MATIVAQATGNWSAGATWTGGAVPGANDIAQTGAYTVTIDVNITCTQLEATSSGRFEVASGGITINANVVMSTSYTNEGSVRCTHSTGTVTINGNLAGGNAANRVAVGNNSTGTLTIVGSITGGIGFSTTHGLRNRSTGTVNITGNCTSSSGHAVYNESTGAINLTGDALGCGSNTSGAGVYNASSGTITITGNATGGSTSSTNGSKGAWNNSTGTINISGNATGGSGVVSYGAYNHSTGTVTCDTAIGGTAADSPGLWGQNSGGTTTFKKATRQASACASWGGFCKMVIDADYNEVVVVRSDTGADYTMSNDYPAVTDVKDGVIYNRTTLEGTLTELGCPDDADVLDSAGGTYHAPSVGEVIDTAVFGPSSGTSGTFAIPAEADVKDGVGYGAGGTEFEGELAASGGGIARRVVRQNGA